MGRYYSGDIEGKFWFGIQPSNDASFFGGTQLDPSSIDYHFDESDLDDIQCGIRECEDHLGKWKSALDAFLAAHHDWNDEMLIAAGFPAEKIADLLVWYARLELGEKILNCVKKNGVCRFEAEF
jgi:hypothetical protein